VSEVHITACDCVTCLGDGVDALWQSLLANKCGFRPARRFATSNYVNSIAGCVEGLDEVEHGKRFGALLERLCQKGVSVPSGATMLTATTKDNIELHETYVRKSGAGYLPSGDTMLDSLRERLGGDSFGFNVNAACASSSAAILYGAEMIRDRQTDVVVVWAADIVSEFVFSGFSALKAMSPGMARPFDVNRDGLILGEAAGYVVLMSGERTLKEKRTSLGVLKGWGMSSDAYHITAPDRHGRGLQRAVANALERADLATDSIASIGSHGTGTLYNDAMEVTAFKKIFDSSMPPMYAIKGAIGHSLGACGLIEVIVALRCLNEQLVPPMVGMLVAEPDVADCVATEKRRISGRYSLATNSGFGGINTALVLEKA
jgi:3-oxoacyl-[acyl-carrier-protein] synthase II